MTELLIIIAGTFASEDLACITVGMLIARGNLSPEMGLAGCYVGILVGDIGLWALGRCFGAVFVHREALRRRLPQGLMTVLSKALEQSPMKCLLAARFIPGMRFPIYVAAGMLQASPLRFAAAAALAGLVWTPILIGVVAILGEPVVAPLMRIFRSAWIGVPVAVFVVFIVIRLLHSLVTLRGRTWIAVQVARVRRWEFWPAWFFYLPVLPWILWLSIRYRGLTAVTAANPGIPHGGIVGESKSRILQRLPSAWVAPFHCIPAGDHDDRIMHLRELIESGWTFPLILKPDVGERGAGVKLVEDFDQAARNVRQTNYSTIVQFYHPGPYEAGVFYYRMPGESCGRILSITDKQFPVVLGDGTSTLEELILRHSRFRMQARVFLERLNGKANAVLRSGESFRLAVAGNHCQGTLFRDGGHLITPELESRIDEIAKNFDSFYFGRFDVRYRDVEEFKSGAAFSIIELNGVTSESTNLYDPSWSIGRAYRQLFLQWRILFEIGARNRSRGHAVTPFHHLLTDVLRHYRTRNVCPIAD